MSTMITVPFELTLDQLIDIVRQLDRPSRLKLIRAVDTPAKQEDVSDDLAQMLEGITDDNLHDEVKISAKSSKRSILELRGLGKEVWAGVDVDALK